MEQSYIVQAAQIAAEASKYKSFTELIMILCTLFVVLIVSSLIIWLVKS